MVDRLASTLDIPLRQHNALLLAAGFAPEWRQRDLAAPDMAQVTNALDYMLAQQEPYPAVVVDRHWNLLKSNAAAVRRSNRVEIEPIQITFRPPRLSLAEDQDVDDVRPRLQLEASRGCSFDAVSLQRSFDGL